MSAVEDAAVRWVMAYERERGREPVDRRFDKAFPGDLESPPRIIEVKATGTSYRGWFLAMQPVQVEHALTDATFCVYVVENNAQGDPSRFTLRILEGDHLRQMAAKATERRYFEVPWPTADYEATAVERQFVAPTNRWGDAHFVRVHLWALPRDRERFLAWLADVVPGESDRARLSLFLERYSVATELPAELREQLTDLI
jgi:hypothetical protein